MVEATLPTLHHLRAALRAVRAIDPSGNAIASLRDSFLRLPTGGLFRSEDLMAGARLLERAGLLSREGEVWRPKQELFKLTLLEEDDACEVLLALILMQQPPIWFFSATREDILAEELMSDDDAIILKNIIPDPARREALLLAAARRYSSAKDEETGCMGEEHVYQLLRSELQALGRTDLADRVQRVSLISDQLGYDIVAPTLGESSRRLEVKTTRRAEELLEVVISRGEAEVGLRDPDWALVVCRVSAKGILGVVGWCRGEVLRDYLPVDRHSACRWASAWIKISASALNRGLPPYEA